MDNIRDKADSKNKSLLYTVQSVVTTRKITSIATGLIMLAIVGVFQFISLGCDISKLLEWSFYLTLTYRTILVFLAYFTAVNFLYDKCLAHSDIQNAISEFRKLTKVRDSNFPEFLENIYNPKLKKEAWRDKVNTEITNLERKCLRAPVKRRGKYLDKIKTLKTYLTDEYINEHIDTLNVKYYHVLESDFLAVELLEGSSKNKTRIDYESVVFKSVLKKIIPFILISIVLGAVITGSITRPAWEVIVNLLSDLIIIVLRIGQGCWDCPKIINSSYLVPYTNRIGILKEYINWSADVPKSKAHILVSKLEAETEEITENKKGE